MLTDQREAITGLDATALQSDLILSNRLASEIRPGMKQDRLAKILCVEWLGQTVASLCWIASIVAYGITATGDWFQLLAASAWLVANIAAVVTTQAE